MRWNNRRFGKWEDLAPCLRRVTSLLPCGSLQLPGHSCTIPAPSTGCACSGVAGTEMPVSLSRRKGYCWVALSAPGLLLGVESGQWTNCPKKKNCGETRLHFPESLCGSINGGLGVEGGLEREWRSHVEVREKRGWERKQIVSHSTTSVRGRHCAGGCERECYSGQPGMGRFVERQLLPVWN